MSSIIIYIYIRKSEFALFYVCLTNLFYMPGLIVDYFTKFSELDMTRLSVFWGRSDVIYIYDVICYDVIRMTHGSRIERGLRWYFVSFDY